jgi:hypothetical protein
MKGNKIKNLPAFRSVDELEAFFETHDMGDYWEKLPEVELRVDSKKTVSTGDSKATSSKTKSDSSAYF